MLEKYFFCSFFFALIIKPFKRSEELKPSPTPKKKKTFTHAGSPFH